MGHHARLFIGEKLGFSVKILFHFSMLTKLHTTLFKNSFINRCIFGIVWLHLWSQSPIVYINSALYFNLNEFFWTLYDNSGDLNRPLSMSTVHCLTLDIGHCIFYFYFCFYPSCVCVCIYMQCDCHCFLLKATWVTWLDLTWFGISSLANARRQWPTQNFVTAGSLRRSLRLPVGWRPLPIPFPSTPSSSRSRFLPPPPEWKEIHGHD